jgi:hypothetical protein
MSSFFGLLGSVLLVIYGLHAGSFFVAGVAAFMLGSFLVDL